MKRKSSLFFSLALTLVLLLACLLPALAALTPEKQLQFNDDGTFTILQLADTQDGFFPRPPMIEFIDAVLDQVQPDLVIFTGDNITGSSFIAPLAKRSIDCIVSPVEKRSIPFTVTFGNHDDETFVSRETQLALYQAYENCLAFDADPDLTGCANHNLTILSSDGTKTAFNLWLIDSNTYESNMLGNYDYVHEDQIRWYEAQSQALETANGGKVPSLLFQHIAVPEIYQLLKPTAPGTKGSKEYAGTTWALELNPDLASGYLGEWPCPPVVNSGQFASWVNRGDIVGAVFGHDHVNSFIGSYQGIDLIQSPGVNYASYGDNIIRGCRVITLDESDLWSYGSYTLTYDDVLGTENQTMRKLLGSFLGFPAAAFIALWEGLQKLFAVVWPF